MVLKEQRSHVCLWGAHYVQPLSWGLETRVMKNIIYIDHKRHWEVAENHDFSCVYPIKYIFKKIHLFDLLGRSDTKESACSAGDPGLIPGLGRSPEQGNDYPLQYSFLKNSTDRGAWWATVHGVAKSRIWPSNSHTHVNAVFQQKSLLNSVMRTLICLHFWISRHLLKLTFLESSKNPQALTSHRDPLWSIHMFVWDWGGPLTVAQGLFVHQFRISGEGQDQRVYTYFSMLQLGCYHYWATFWNWTWKMFSPSKNYQLYITLYNPINSLLHMHCIGLPGLTWVCDHTLIDFYEKMYLEFQTADL